MANNYIARDSLLEKLQTTSIVTDDLYGMGIMSGKVVTNMAMKIGYIQEIDLQLNPQYKERFRFKEASFTRRISSRGDRVYSKMLAYPVDYEEIVDNANIMKKNSKVILVREPFLLDDELRKKVTEWVEWANAADPHEYDPFA